ncbi:MAG: preprotein translocase subunit SecG [Myxococcota bacterium]
MQLFLNIFHVVLSISLILIILIQPGKDQGAVFGGGGGGNKMYAPRGQNSLIGRATTAVAVMFMFTSISLAFYSTERAREGSNIEDVLDELEVEADEEDGGGFFNDRRPADIPAPPVRPIPEGEQEVIDAAEGAASGDDEAGAGEAPENAEE